MHRLYVGLMVVGAAVAMAVVATSQADEPTKKDLAALQGNWSVESLEYNGKDVTARYKLSFAFKDDVATVEGDEGVRKEYAKIRFKLYPELTPRGVDLTVAGGVQVNLVMEGIYELKGDQMRLCVKFSGKDRPSEFAAPGGSSIAYLTLKRQN